MEKRQTRGIKKAVAYAVVNLCGGAECRSPMLSISPLNSSMKALSLACAAAMEALAAEHANPDC